MGMDALTNAAFESLTRDVLPKLARKLAEAGKAPPDGRTPPEGLAYLLREAHELLTLLGDWAAPAADAGDDSPIVAAISEMPEASEDSDMSDEDAMALLSSEGVESLDAADVHVNTHKSVADSLSDDSDEGDDDDAALLALLEGGAAEGRAEVDGEMSDDDARRLLEEMDAPAAPPPRRSSVGAGRPALMQTSAKLTEGKAEGKAPAAKATANDEMGDDEAMALLAAMDAPAAGEPGDGGEMSDDEARKLLAMMDDPAADAAPEAAADEESSADDEAMAMLKALGGLDDEAPAKAKAGAKGGPASPFTAHANPDEEDLQEIPERSDNEFANDPEMMKDFSTNTDDLMETLDSTILQLEQNPGDRETIESIFRAAHTLKGAAGMFGFKAIERVMHRMEGLFDQVRKGVLVPDSNIIDVVFQGIDVLRGLLDGVKENKKSGVLTVPIVRALEAASRGCYRSDPTRRLAGTPGKGSMGGAPAKPAGDGGGHDEGAPEAGDDARPDAKAGGPKKKKEEQSTIRVDLERLDHLVNLVGELVIDRTRFASIEEELRTTQPQIAVAGNMSETVQLFGRHMNEIHEIIMKIRMVPIGSVFNKFTRIVRDLSRQLDKEIELYIDGEDTELDKTLVEQIGDPLIHLIRNSCDHGVEMPATRTASGKNSMGKIFLSARQEGNHIIITIEDDGKGINVDAIRKKGVERGLVAEDAQMSDRDIINLIFEPGFSTAEKVTTVSGRGVGMDVVRKQISKLKGLIDIDTKLGKGTTTTIRLPLTLAIVQSLLIEAQGECFAIPLSTVVESVRIKPDEIQRVGDAEVIKRHGKVLPLMHLHETLELGRKADLAWYSGHHRAAERRLATTMHVNKRKDRLYVVIVGSGDRRFGIVVDQLLHQQEMVIKSLGPVMKNTPCVAGGAVLGNGEVVLVLDIQELEDTFRTKARPLQAA